MAADQGIFLSVQQKYIIAFKYWLGVQKGWKPLFLIICCVMLWYSENRDAYIFKLRLIQIRPYFYF